MLVKRFHPIKKPRPIDLTPFSRYKTWRLIGLHPLCGVFLTVGYGMREYGAYNYKYDPDSKIALNMFIISQVFIYICP